MKLVVPRRPRRLFMSLAVLALALAPSLAGAQEPALVVHAGGESHTYPVTLIEQVILADSTLSVVQESGVDSYPMSPSLRLDFQWGAATVDPAAAPAIIRALRLFPNQPNPFSKSTRLGFELARPGRIALRILSADGRLRRTLIDREEAAGNHEVSWDGLADDGRRLPSGVYFYELVGPGVREGRKLIYLP